MFFVLFFCSQFSYFIVFNLKCACDLVFFEARMDIFTAPSSFTCVSVSNNTLCVASELFLHCFFLFCLRFQLHMGAAALLSWRPVCVTCEDNLSEMLKNTHSPHWRNKDGVKFLETSDMFD